MNPEQIFTKAIGIESPDQREAYLQEVCGNDQVLRNKVEKLLKAHADSEAINMFQAAYHDDSRATLESVPLLEESGTQVGRYKLLEKIGEGGMAVVYMAEQKHPIRRRVALKLIKLGMDSKQVIARFEAERQALALMDHPNIAQVLDAGTSETGRPYFVMELVKGVCITEFCDQNELDTRERLALFVSVCQAVHHAHQKGIIHRDLKPSNIMVTLHDGEPVVKVIDFGVAKAVNQQLTEKTVFTRYSQMIGTPEYMSPEQAEMSGLDMDTRTDVFSLGVLLYELLTGTTPLDSEYLRSKGYGELQRIIREEEPVRPSTKVSTLGDSLTIVAKHRRTSPEHLCKLIRTDLDWIVMKTLEKDRKRRYASVSEFAADIERHLNHEPVHAGRPSAVYRIQKFVKRNRVWVTSAAVVFITLLLATGISLWQMTRANYAAAQLAVEKENALTAEQAARIAAGQARAAEQVAKVAQQREIQLRHQAEAQELAARQRAYAADMLVCREAVENDNLRRARQLLERQRPGEGQEDLRGWEWRYLWRHCQGDAPLELAMQGRRPFNAVFTNSGNSVLTFTSRGRIGLWNLANRKEEAILQDDWLPSQGDSGHSTSHLCISADGQWVAACDRNPIDGSLVRIWEVATQKTIAKLTIGEVDISSLAISPDKKTLAVYAQFHAVLLWDITTQQERRRIPVYPGRREAFSGAVRYSPDGKILAIGDADRRVRLLRADTATEMQAFSVSGNSTAGISSLDFSPNGRFLAVGTVFTDPHITIWDVEANTRVGTLEGHVGFIGGLAFSPDGQYLASASADQTIKLWNTRDWSLARTLLGHNDEVWSVNFSRDGERLVSTCKDNNVFVWDMSGQAPKRGSIGLPAGIRHVDVSPDGKTIVAVSNEGDVQLLETSTLQRKSAPGSLGANNLAAFWTSAQHIVLGSHPPLMLKAWNVSTNTVSTFELGPAGRWPLFRYFPQSQVLTAKLRHSDTKYRTTIRWDTAAHQVLSSHTIDTSKYGHEAFSQDTRWLALARRGPSGVELRNLSTGQPVCNLDATTINQCIALLPDGQGVVTSGWDAPTINVWDVSTQNKLISFPGHNLILRHVVLSADGRRMATSTIGQQPIKLWDTSSWEEVGSLVGRTDVHLRAPAFLSDGNTIAAIEEDLEHATVTYRLWQAPSWEEIEAAESADNGASIEKGKSSDFQ